jgi:hypothetical protein
MKTPFNTITTSVLAITTMGLLAASIYHFSICPLHNPPAPVLFPTIVLQTNITYSVGQPTIGDKVLVMKQYIGVVTATNELDYHCTVLFLNTKTIRTLPVLGRFPYTVLQKIIVAD